MWRRVSDNVNRDEVVEHCGDEEPHQNAEN
jgi:hypothetical protein